ncbi:MAG: RluA family pseudouridine synthase [Clostridia bacterium]|nr:RluA family pseudouridine synthase [Clostridia bacterium]
MTYETYTVDGVDEGKRLDSFLAERAEITRSASAKLIEAGGVAVNGKEEAKSFVLSAGMTVEVAMPDPEPIDAQPEDIPLDIVYEDADIIVVNKPKGMVVHPAAGNPSGTLVNALLFHCGDSLSGINGKIRPGIVHRIDKNTSGLLVCAKNDAAHVSLAEQLKEYKVERKYEAIVVGRIKNDEGTVNAPIGRHPVDRKRMAVMPGGREAITHYRVLDRYEGFTHLELQLETGRTHQIRVHMKAEGHPVMGDTLYGAGRTPFEQHNAKLLHEQCLHARTLALDHPSTGEHMVFEAPLPEYFTRILAKLEGTRI